MGGDILVQSQPGVGSTFTIRLPVEVVNGQPRAETPAPAPLAARSPAALPGTSSVLVIDDDPAVHELLTRFLSKEGFHVLTAASGEEGLRLARTLHPAAITLDVLMPGMDGWAVLVALKADLDLADIPVVMLTIVEDRNIGYAVGASDYLIKPVDRDRLLRILETYRRTAPRQAVLVVEDEAATRELLRRMLEREGWVVLEAENGRIALERMAQEQPAIILLDLMMPEMDGFAFVVELRNRPDWRAIPIIVVTACDISAEDRQRLNGYVEKILGKGTHSREELLAEVRELITTYGRRRSAVPA